MNLKTVQDNVIDTLVGIMIDALDQMIGKINSKTNTLKINSLMN